jgi:hypothetical protein
MLTPQRPSFIIRL